MDVDVDENLSFDDFGHWSVVALQDYCTKRGYPRTGTKAELAAMAYTAYRTQAPIQLSEAEKVKQAKIAYQEKLTLPCGTLIPDPLTSTSGWEGEATAIRKWPNITHGDIIHYFTMKQGLVAKETLNKYKEGKAFSYFSSQYVKEVMHLGFKEFCVLKTCVTRSGSVGEEPHHTWVCTRVPSGDILRAYCTCTAGLNECCNHLAGLLFRVEAAVSAGLSNPSCTSLPSTWIVPAAKTVVLLGEIHTFDFVQPSAGTKKSRPLVSQEKRDFQPYSDKSTERDRLDSLMSKLSLVKPNCAASRLWVAERDLECTASASNASTEQLEKPVAMYLDDYLVGKTLHMDCSVGEKVKFIGTHLPGITDAEVKCISNMTVQQSSSEEWKRSRKGRITASKFGRVHSRVKTIKSAKTPEEINIGPLLVDLMDYNPPDPNLATLQYGRDNEKFARSAYVKHQTDTGHVNLTIDLAGLIVSRDDVFLAASPDVLVHCDCCGYGIAEIKCPFTLRGKDSIITNAPSFMDNRGGDIHLKENHAYFAQIQGQLAITQRSWCDLVIFCSQDIFVERISMNQQYWSELKANLTYFYQKYLLREILTNEHRPTEQVERVKSKFKRSNYLQRKMNLENDMRADADCAILSVACNVTVDSTRSAVVCGDETTRESQ